jgi:hypothetical protein
MRFSFLSRSTAGVLAVAAAVLAGAHLQAQDALPLDLASISADRMVAHVRFLADDLLEGRSPGARGGDLAAKYIATQFA